METKIQVQRGYSEDGGFNYAVLRCEDRELLSRVREKLVICGQLRELGSGYTSVSEHAEQHLVKGREGFTEQEATDYAAMVWQILNEREERRRKGLVKCDCGHTVHRSQVMNASRGSSCPDCYDRMSD